MVRGGGTAADTAVHGLVDKVLRRKNVPAGPPLLVGPSAVSP